MSAISDTPGGWEMLQDENMDIVGITDDKHYTQLRKKLRSAQDETLR